MPGKRISTNNRGTDIFSVVSGKARQFKASIGKETSPVAFTATGGTASSPGDGYRYHVFNNGESGAFIVVQGSANVQVMLQGAGAGGNYGFNTGGNGNGGRGGAGGATGVWDVNNLQPGTCSFAIGGGGGAPGGAGNDTVFTTGSNDTLTSKGGNPGPANNDDTGFGSVTTQSLTGDYTTSGRSGYRPSGSPGEPGEPAAGLPQPTNEWWRPYISPGSGGQGGSHGSNGGVSAGQPYGGGGGGGAGSGDDDSAGQGQPGASGRAVIRYLLGQ